MRRGGAKAAAAAVAALPARSLRPLLFLLVSLFLVLPMLVYNVFTLDYSRISKWSDAVGDPTGVQGALTADRNTGNLTGEVYDEAAASSDLPLALKNCAAIRLSDISTDDRVAAVRQRCFDADKTADSVEPVTVHFVYLPVHMVPLLEGEKRPPAENFTMIQFAAVQSVRRHVKPKFMVLHYPATEPRSFWYTQCQRHLSLHRVLFPALPSAKKSSLNVYQRRDIMQLVLALRALRKHGGLAFADFNTFLVRPLSSLPQLPFVAGRARKNSFSVSPTMLMARQNSPHVADLEAKLMKMLEADDEQLRSTPLPRLIGELLAATYESKAASAPDAKPNALFTSPTVLDAVPATELKNFLADKLSEPTTDLRNAIAFRLPQSSPHSQQSAVGDGITALRLVEKKTHDFETLADDQSLFGAILRYSISLNTTAELDAVLL